MRGKSCRNKKTQTVVLVLVYTYLADSYIHVCTCLVLILACILRVSLIVLKKIRVTTKIAELKMSSCHQARVLRANKPTPKKWSIIPVHTFSVHTQTKLLYVPLFLTPVSNQSLTSAREICNVWPPRKPSHVGSRGAGLGSECTPPPPPPLRSTGVPSSSSSSSSSLRARPDFDRLEQE